MNESNEQNYFQELLQPHIKVLNKNSHRPILIFNHNRFPVQSLFSFPADKSKIGLNRVGVAVKDWAIFIRFIFTRTDLSVFSLIEIIT